MHGFKSFAQQTELKFDPGVTAIVGPNGCGKSNIVDAVRWVTGEQRARILRSDKMDSVIFNGTAKRKPLGMSEVTLTVENTRGILPTEYAEVTIGRRLYRSGESEYLLNGVQCRLKDILDLFMDTGMGPGAYSVIELKMIEEILSENTQERRRLFEEAAGITKYKLRRTQALRKLDNTQANLTRIRDLTDEIGKRVVSLKRQAEKAVEAKKLQARLEALELQLAQSELNHLKKIEKSLSEEARTLKDELEEHTAQQSREEAELESLRLDLIDQEKELASRQQALNEHLEQVRTLETEKRLTLERLESAGRNVDRAVQEQEEADGRIAQLQEYLTTLNGKLAEAAPLLEKVKQVANTAKAESEKMSARAREAWENLQALRAEEERVERERSEGRRALDRLASRLELMQGDVVRSREQIETFDARIGESETQVRRLQKDFEMAGAAAEKARQALEKAEKEQEARQQEWEKATESLRQIERRYDAVAAELSLLESLMASYEEHSEAVQFLAENDIWRHGPIQTVADLIGCDEELEPALESVLGPYASCIVVKTEAEARKAVTMLRTEEKGQAEIIVLDRLRPVTRYSEFIEEAADRGAYPLIDRVRVSKPEYQQLAEVLLLNCFHVKSLEHGQDLIDTLDEMANMMYDISVPMRYVAETGEWLDARGIFRGGSRRNGQVAHVGRLKRQEQYEAAGQNLRELEAALEQKQTSAAEARTALDAVSLEDPKRRRAEAERLLAEAEKAFARAAHEYETLEQRKQEESERARQLESSIFSVHKEIEQLDNPVKEAETLLEDLRSRRSEAEELFRAAENENRRALNQANEANIAAVQARNHFENLTRDLERNKQDTAILRSQSTARQEHIVSLKNLISENEQALRDLEEQIVELYGDRAGFDGAVDEAEQIRQATQQHIMELESRLRTIRQTREQGIRAESDRAVKLAEVHTRVDDLLQSIYESFERSLLDDPVDVPEGFEIPASKREARELRVSLRSLGSINELALESYEEEKERYEFMSAQQEDLEKAEQSLLDTIEEINTTASQRFDETFQKIRQNFAHLFSTLFGKDDTADLILTDPDDPLESPIDIIAKPKGKRPSAISQLSGGEKTLTSTALLFAIYLVKPSPFCILDEVDAPLDEANVERFMQLIREFSDRTQFILVTHNRRTMELADRLYGITMQEEGISKLVGVKFDEVEDMVEA